MPKTKKLSIDKVQDQVERFMTDTDIARDRSERCRDYYDHKQWTEAEAQKLRNRNQAPIVVNRVRYKVNGLVGLYDLRKTDPKAFPRTPKHEESSHSVTDALRFVADNNDFGEIRLNVANEFFVEGYSGAAVVPKEKKNGEIEIQIQEIPWDRIYYDPHSRARDFSDARYMGFYMWLSEDEAREKFPDADIDQLIADSDYFTDETFEDRPRWFDKDRRRVRIAVHFCIHDGEWYYSVFTDSTFLEDPIVSPFLDDEQEPCCPMELVAGNIDRENQRYGETLCWLDQQDEINHRRSKALHLLNYRQTASRKGALKDVKETKRELAKPDGHVEYEGEKGDFEVLETGDMLRGQFELYTDAKSELDAVSYNAQLAGERQQGNLSGVAIDKLQTAGTIELNQQFSLLAGWEKRIYRQIWGRVRQYWTDEKWIRITDDQDNLKWVGLNSQMTAREAMEDKIQDEAMPLSQRRQLAKQYQFLTQAEQQRQNPQLAEQANQRLEQIVDVRNPVAELDVDIIIDQSFDSVNVQEEQFKMMAQFASSQDIDIIELVELSQLRGKDELIEKIEKRRQQQQQAQQGAMQIEQAKAQAEIQKDQADAHKKTAEAQSAQTEAQLKAFELQNKSGKTQAEIRNLLSQAEQRELENWLLLNDPERVHSVSV